MGDSYRVVRQLLVIVVLAGLPCESPRFLFFFFTFAVDDCFAVGVECEETGFYLLPDQAGILG